MSHLSMSVLALFQPVELDEVQGCEAIRTDPRTGLVYMACGNRKARTRWLHPNSEYNQEFEQYKDHVLVVDEKDSIRSLDVLERDSGGALVPFGQDFRVHGFDIYWDDLDPEELTFMFVNHQQSGPAVSIFTHRLGTSHIQHVETVRSPLLQSPNDVLAVSRRAFYVTNDLRHLRGRLRKLEEFLGMPWGSVVHRGHEGVFSTAYSGLAYPNGIAASPDRSLVYIACSSEPSVSIFRPGNDGTLEFVGKTVFRAFVPDNISVDAPTGQVLVAGKLSRPFPTGGASVQYNAMQCCCPCLSSARVAS
ncbi:calcium-dependent phosphotriesterase [Martensiomyces pterosporus]|nr:calcium-dependent phosphotriesterase [Martensiomyces pterosporus]